MTRQKVNGNRIRSAGNPDEEPDLSLYPICRDDDSNNVPRSSPNSSSSASLIATSGAAGRDILVTGDASSQQPIMTRTAPTPTVSDPSVNGAISDRNTTVGVSPFLRVL